MRTQDTAQDKNSLIDALQDLLAYSGNTLSDVASMRDALARLQDGQEIDEDLGRRLVQCIGEMSNLPAVISGAATPGYRTLRGHLKEILSPDAPGVGPQVSTGV